MKILVIIPARSGSKSIKDKNIIEICGKPLIAYSFEPALKLLKKKVVDKVICSTDSEKYAQIAKRYGIEVPFLRPAAIATDKSKSIDFILHALNFFEKKNINFDAVMLLQPTSPIRNVKMLTAALDLFKKNKATSLISCYEEAYVNTLVMYKQNNDGFLMPLDPSHNKGTRKQDHGSVYVRNGSIYITKVDYLKKTHQIISDAPLLFLMKKIDSINLDTMDDLKILTKILCR